MLLRRFLVIAALMFWQGGFTFYAAVVVPVGQSVLGSHLEQGFITRQVTNYLNLSGAVALLILGWDIWVCRDARIGRRRCRWVCWWAMAALLVGLAWQHGQLENLIDPDALRIAERRLFRSRHRVYLWLSTIQWGLSIAYLWMSLKAWKDADGMVCAEVTHRA